jgi:hypothetical protein
MGHREDLINFPLGDLKSGEFKPERAAAKADKERSRCGYDDATAHSSWLDQGRVFYDQATNIDEAENLHSIINDTPKVKWTVF